MNHNDLYQRWLGTNLEDADLSVELESIKGQEEDFAGLWEAVTIIPASQCSSRVANERVGTGISSW